MIQKEFISYEHALALKELGFDEVCIASYDNNGEFKDPFEYNSEKNDGYLTNSSLKDPKNFNALSNSALLKEYLDSSFTAAPLYQQAFKWLHQQLGFKKSVMYLDAEDREVLLNNNIKSLKEKHGNTSN